jgi:cobalt/nickel transport system permease protein
MIMELHSRSASPIDRLDPRAILIATAGSAFCFSFIRNLALSLLCLVFSLILAAVRRLPTLPLLKHLAMVNAFILFIWLTVPLTMRGDSLVALGPLSWSREGVGLALLVTVKCNAILLSFLALTAGLSLQEIGCALERLRVPARLVFLFLFTCRYIHVIGEEWRRLQTAARLRGFVPRNSPHTYRTIANMLGLAFINAVDRSHRIYEAMLLRGFDGVFHTVTEFKCGSTDIVFTLLIFAFLGSLLFLDLCLK